MDRTPFRFCPRCHAKFPYTDQHLVCNLCLSPDHREEICEACRSFRSKKTLRDRRARRLEMASKSTENLDVMEEEQAQTAVSIRDTDSEEESEEDMPITAGQHVSTSAPAPTHKKLAKALGTPLPEGHGSARRKTVVDRPSGSASKKATPPSTSESSKSLKRATSDSSKHPHYPESKARRPASEPKQATSFSGPKKSHASEPRKTSYTEEQGLSSKMKQISKPMQESRKTSEEETEIQPILEVMDERQSRIHIHRETGRILTAPPLKTKRKLAFQEELDSAQPPAKVQKLKQKPPPLSVSPPHSPQLSFSPQNSPPPLPSPTHSLYSHGDTVDPWDLYDPDPIPDNDPDLYPSKPSPPEDTTAYTQVVARAAAYHGVLMHSEPLEEDFLFNTLSSTHSRYQSLPMLPGMVKHADQIFMEPVKARVITPRIDKKYKPPPTDPEYITRQVLPDSVVVSAARKRANSQSSGDTPPPDKESRKFDAAGKRVATQAATQWRIANSQALLARYDRAHWDEMQELIQHLPKEHQKRAQQVVEEGQAISNNQIRSALDAADTAARSTNTAITIRRHAWLRSSGFKPEIQQAVLNMPFDKKHLFGPEVDTTIEKLKKDSDTAKAMGALYTTPYRGSFRRPQFRGGFRPQSSEASTSQTKQGQQTQFQRGGFRGSYRGQYSRNRGKFQSSKQATTPSKQ